MKALLLIALIPCAALVACNRAESPQPVSSTTDAVSSSAMTSRGADGSAADIRAPDADVNPTAGSAAAAETHGREDQPGVGTGNGPATNTGPSDGTPTTITGDGRISLPASTSDASRLPGTPPINGSGGRMPGSPPPAPTR